MALALVCFLAPLLALPISWARGSEGVWVQSGFYGHRVTTLITADEPASKDNVSIPLLASLEGAGLWRVSAGSEGWEAANAGLPNDRWSGITLTSLAILSTTPPLALAVNDQGRVYQSADWGQSWEEVASLPHSAQPALLSASQTGGVYLLAQPLLYRSEDAGRNWDSVGVLPEGMVATSLSTDLPIMGWLIVGTSSGQILRSADNGQTWIEPQSAMPPGHINVIAGVPDGLLYAATSSGLLRSSDGGANWHYVSPALQTKDVRALILDTTNPHALYIGLERGGTFFSVDDGEDWSILGHGVERHSVGTMALDANGRMLYAGTDNGVWKFDLSTIRGQTTAVTDTPMHTVTPSSTSTPTLKPSATDTKILSTSTSTRKVISATTRRPTRAISPTRTRTSTATSTQTGTSTATHTQRPTQPATPMATATPSPTFTPVPATVPPPTDEPALTPEAPSPTPPR